MSACSHGFNSCSTNYGWTCSFQYLVEDDVALSLALSSFLEEGNWARISSNKKTNESQWGHVSGSSVGRHSQMTTRDWTATCDVELSSIELLQQVVQFAQTSPQQWGGGKGWRRICRAGRPRFANCAVRSIENPKSTAIIKHLVTRNLKFTIFFFYSD